MTSTDHILRELAKERRVRVRESHLVFGWVPIENLSTADLRPHVVRDVIVSGKMQDARHLVEMADQ